MTAARSAWVLAAAAALCVPSQATDVTDAVHAWMGKWPNEPFNAQPVQGPKPSKDHRTFWQVPGTRAGLEAAIGKKRAALVIGVWTVGDDLKMAGPRWATYATCKPHDCGDNEADVFIDTVSGRFNVCWTERAQSQWLAPGQPAVALGEYKCKAPDSAQIIAQYAR